MLGVDIDVDKVDNIGKKVKKAQKQRIKDAGDKGFAFSQEVVPEDRGTLRQSGFTPEWEDAETLRWGYTARQARPMEFGTEPFYPPLQPLLEWSERVTGDKGLGFYVAQHKIPNEGVDSQPYVRPGREVMRRYLKNNKFGDYLNDEL